MKLAAASRPSFRPPACTIQLRVLRVSLLSACQRPDDFPLILAAFLNEEEGRNALFRFLPPSRHSRGMTQAWQEREADCDVDGQTVAGADGGRTAETVRSTFNYVNFVNEMPLRLVNWYHQLLQILQLN